MEDKKKLPVKVSKFFILDLDDIYNYGITTFGIRQAQIYESGEYLKYESQEV